MITLMLINLVIITIPNMTKHKYHSSASYHDFTRCGCCHVLINHTAYVTITTCTQMFVIIFRSLLFRQADKVNYLKTPSQISDSRYNSARYQSDNTENAKNQSQRYSEAHKYDVPANNKAARNEYDHIDFQYEQAEHPFQQSHSNGAPHVAYYEEGPQPKYNVLVHSSSMDKLGQSYNQDMNITVCI